MPVLVAEGPQTAASEFAPGPRFGFPARNAATLAARLDDLLGHPLQLRAAAARCARAARELDFERCTSHMESAYRFVMGGEADLLDAPPALRKEDLNRCSAG